MNALRWSASVAMHPEIESCIAVLRATWTLHSPRGYILSHDKLCTNVHLNATNNDYVSSNSNNNRHGNENDPKSRTRAAVNCG